MSSRLRMLLFVTCIAILAGCSRERQDWQSAQTADTIEAYGSFITKHGDSPLVTQAEARIRQLGEERDWQQAATLDTLEAYQAYLRQHPESKWADEARIRVENFSLGDTPAKTTPAPAAGAASPPTASPPAAASAAPSSAAPPPAAPSSVAPPPATSPPSAASTRPAPAPSTAVPPSGYGVQLGAFGSEAGARTAWQGAVSRHGAVLAGLEPAIAPVASGSGKLYRLRAAVPSEAKARSVCEALRARSQACVVVLPVGK
ncbi:MAG: SPOR domain-containing protein [Steroidobacteraceae bacterium]|nr:SPOR domain-containing protein [Steroidobacteraceae bacterium]